jgi:hypothetical protein
VVLVADTKRRGQNVASGIPKKLIWNPEEFFGHIRAGGAVHDTHTFEALYNQQKIKGEYWPRRCM